MSEESKKIEEIEKEAKQDVKEVKPTELSEQELNDVAGGGTVPGSRSNIKNNIA
jgi:predicted ATP-dependent serine protease